jgi:hypothetical protein
MNRRAAALLGLFFLFSVREGRADVHIGELEIFLSRLETRGDIHEREVNGPIIIQKMRIAELEDKIIKLEAMLEAKKWKRADRTVSSAPASL